MTNLPTSGKQPSERILVRVVRNGLTIGHLGVVVSLILAAYSGSNLKIPNWWRASGHVVGRHPARRQRQALYKKSHLSAKETSNQARSLCLTATSRFMCSLVSRRARSRPNLSPLYSLRKNSVFWR